MPPELLRDREGVGVGQPQSCCFPTGDVGKEGPVQLGWPWVLMSSVSHATAKAWDSPVVTSLGLTLPHCEFQRPLSSTFREPGRMCLEDLLCGVHEKPCIRLCTVPIVHAQGMSLSTTIFHHPKSVSLLLQEPPLMEPKGGK